MQSRTRTVTWIGSAFIIELALAIGVLAALGAGVRGTDVAGGQPLSWAESVERRALMT